jgi:hypothetical protein
MVWGRWNDPDDRWQPEREPLSRFAVQILLFETIMGARHNAFGWSVTAAAANVALLPMSRLPLGSWRWPAEPGFFYGGEDLLAFVNPGNRIGRLGFDRLDVILAARSRASLSYLLGIDGFELARSPALLD